MSEVKFNAQESVNELVARVVALESTIATLVARIVVLETPTNTAQKEMTDEHARTVIASDKKHNDIAKELGLSYGQVYSCRLGYTFKHVHKSNKENNIPNRWIK